jgi:hypothetical protein
MAMRSIRFFQSTVLLGLILPLVGCFHASATIVEPFNIETDADTLISPSIDGVVFVERGCGKPKEVSARSLKEQWGLPAKTLTMEDGKELWQYRRGLRWGGLFVFLAVGIIPLPLPLVVPIGSREYDFTVVNDQIQDVRVVLSKYGPSTGFHIGFTFDESGRTLYSA